MRFSTRAGLFMLVGLVAGLAIPEQFSLADFHGKEACHSIFTSCRASTDCCSGLQCGTFDDETLCVPGG